MLHHAFSLRASLSVGALVVLMLLACRSDRQSARGLDTNPESESVSLFHPVFRHVPDRQVLVGSHRGGVYPGFPENCLQTMQYVSAAAPGTIHEIDIARTRDGVLVLLHDNSLDRTTTGNGLIEEVDWAYVQSLRLKDIDGSPLALGVPTLAEVLRWAVDEQVYLMLDIKRSVRYEEVLDAVLEAEAIAQVVFIVYSVDGARRMAALHPDALISVPIRNEAEWERFRATDIPVHRVVAFTGTRRSPPALYDTLHAYGIMGILGTLGNLDRQASARGDHLYMEWAADGVDMFSSDRPVELYQAIHRAQ